MIELKQAVVTAMQAAQEYYSNKDLIDLELEEVERSDDEKFWLITLGFDKPNPNPPQKPMGFFNLNNHEDKRFNRKYKLFKVDAETGEVHSMKIRTV